MKEDFNTFHTTLIACLLCCLCLTCEALSIVVLGGEFAVFLFLDCLVLLELELDVIDDSTEVDAAVVFVVVLVFRFLLREMESEASVGMDYAFLLTLITCYSSEPKRG